MNIEDIEGVGPANAVRLREAGVTTVEALLDRGGPRSGRESLAAETGISPKSILEWVNHADLYRISGVGAEFADLLEAAGVDTVAELANRNPQNLAETFGELDAARNTVRRIPSAETVEKWVSEAKVLPRKVEY